MAPKPPTGLSIVTRNADGAEQTLWSGAPPSDRPSRIRCSTKRGEGFSEGGYSLPRLTTRDYYDLNLLDDVWFVCDDGDIVFEGEQAASPGSVTYGVQSRDIAVVGHIAAAKRKRFYEIYKDMDLSGWGSPSRAFLAAWLAINRNEQGAPGVFEDATQTALRLGWTGAWASPVLPSSDLMYDAGPIARVASIYAAFQSNANINPASTGWVARLLNDSASDTFNSSAPLGGAINWLSGGTGAASQAGYLDLSAPARFLMAELLNIATPAGTDGMEYAFDLTKFALYGQHTLTRRGVDPGGFYLSDIFKDIGQRFVPKLDMSGVDEATYVPGHVSFKDGAYPYDAWQQLNDLLLWEMGVFANRQMRFWQADLTDYDWQVSLSEIEGSIPGEDVQALANGVEVTFTNVATGRKETITPDQYPELADTDVENQANRHGETIWPPFEVPFPCAIEDAVQFGRARMAEINQPKSAANFKVTGHIRDRAGHWQAVSKVKYGDRVAIVDHPNQRPRLVHETDYSHDGSPTCQVAVDNTFQRLDAYFDEVAVALAAANVGGV
jgi:hypothetical protein